jgi:hypothetical protein
MVVLRGVQGVPLSGDFTNVNPLRVSGSFNPLGATGTSPSSGGRLRQRSFLGVGACVLRVRNALCLRSPRVAVFTVDSLMLVR